MGDAALSPSRLREGTGAGLLPSRAEPPSAPHPGPLPHAGEHAGEGAAGIRHAISAAAARFTFSPTARLDAELLMAHALGVSREVLLLKHLGDPVPTAFASLADRRERHEPVAYITGSRAFWTIDLHVGPGVLVPRADSETLIEAAVAQFAGTVGPRAILDLGTGPGTLLLAALAEWPGARGLGIDASEGALDYARTNAARLGLAGRATFARGDWARGVDERFDLVLANPPYVGSAEPLPDEVGTYEPGEALFAGADGLDDYRRIVPDLPRLLAPGGVAILEIGATQAAPVSALLGEAGLSVEVRRDLAGHDRALVAHCSASPGTPYFA